jgi:hypothetical protein
MAKEAVAKGLVAGYYRLMTKAGEVVDARLSTKVVQNIHPSPGNDHDDEMS